MYGLSLTDVFFVSRSSMSSATLAELLLSKELLPNTLVGPRPRFLSSRSSSCDETVRSLVCPLEVEVVLFTTVRISESCSDESALSLT
ncbi:Os12g0564701 [Oryza sativa Japonica Group]|uniref:Os12g0564701 protein n=1 Tax=Oryza sativa subsp. japonica TaxID=39947 RepID=A0A0P0YBG3_ORYSJ|nr:hypothetical protein EE612_060306 [Oryza sativa]BAT17677.1 Os12g0564701 [Oryza sativa Japonica Group]